MIPVGTVVTFKLAGIPETTGIIVGTNSDPRSFPYVVEWTNDKGERETIDVGEYEIRTLAAPTHEGERNG